MYLSGRSFYLNTMDIPILYESKWVLAINKPNGLLVERSPYYPSVEDWAVTYIGTQERKPYIGIVHRLDRLVSGVLVLAKRKAALRDLHAQFREKQVEKVYLATVENAPKMERATLTHWLAKDQKEKRAIIFDNARKETAKCELTYKLLQKNAHGFVLEVRPHSGKFHQIRAQLAAIGCPILGDAKYGATLPFQPEAIALHAWKLRFTDPFSQKNLTVETPLLPVFYYE